MANTDRAYGFRPYRHRAGGNTIPVNEYPINSSTGTVLYRGDVVKLEGTGNIEASAANDGVAVLGVFKGCHYKDANGEYQYAESMPASKTGLTEMVAEVYDDLFNTIFRVQCQTGDTPSAATVGSTANHVAGAGNSTTKISGHELNVGAAGGQFRVLGLVNEPGNAWGEHADVFGIFNEHIGANGTASI